MQNMAKVAGDNINLTTIVLIVFCVGWLLERMYKISNNRKKEAQPPAPTPTWSNLRKELDKKVNGEECKEFRARIGKESDEHRANITIIKNDISEIKGGVAYLKGKADGGEQ